jgi:4-methyl-5(b-hydroxyethyl)-thiazole monophosphate biosynthesis
MKKQVVVILADGFEEIEAVSPIDVLRRAGCDVVVAGLGKDVVTSQGGVKITADVRIEQYDGLPDAVVLPGGAQGAINLRNSDVVLSLLDRMKEADRWIGAICAAPGVVLPKTGILKGKKATCYPGYERNFGYETVFSSDRVVTDGKLVTSRGPGTALEFSIELVRRLVGDEIADDILQKMLAKV